MLIRIIQAFRRAALLLGLGCMVPLGAQAGLVSGNWDPAFGSYLPGLSWGASFKMLIPNTCSDQADGDYASTGPCALSPGYVQQLRLQLFNIVDGPGGHFELGSFGWNVGSVRVKNNQIVGVDTGASPVFELTYSSTGGTSPTYFSNPSSALGNTFNLSFKLNGAKLTCLHCVNSFSNVPPPPTNFELPNLDSSPADLKQFLITYTDDLGVVPKFTDSFNQALGARLDGNGVYLGQSTSISGLLVPEPGGLPLVLTAALAGAAALRRRRSPPPPPGVPSAA